MANGIRGITVEIGGDTTKLGDALKSVEKDSKSLSTELGQINKLLKLDPSNTDLLAQKQKVLAGAIEETRKKLNVLKEAEAQVQEQFERGEVSEEQVRALQREIIATTSKLNKYEDASRETAEEIEKLGKDSKDSSEDVEELGDDAKKTGEKLDDAGEKAGQFGEAVKRAGSVAVAGLGAVVTGATALVGALANASVEASAYADDMLTMSTVTGISTDELQAFSYASELVDVDLETLTKSMAKNIKSMSSASEGSKAYANAYAQLGISVKDSNGNLRDSEEVYWEAIDALGKMTNETERDALAMQLFGKSAQELNPLIEAGSETMKELTQEAKDVGAVLSEDALDALGEFDDSIQRLNGSAGATKNALGAVLLPELMLLTTSGTDLLNQFTTELNASGGGLEGLAETIESMSGALVAEVSNLVSQLLNSVTQVAPALVTVAISLISSLATTLISMTPQLVTLGIDLILAILSGLTSAIPQITTAIVDMIPQLVNALVTGIPQLIDGAVQFLLAILEAIPLVIPPLVEAIPQIVLAVIDGLLIAIPQLLEGAIQFLTAIIDAIPLIIQSLTPQIPKIVTTVVNGLLANIPVLLDGAITLFFALIDAIPIIVVELINALPQIITSIVSGLVNAIPTIFSTAKSLFNTIISAIGDLIVKLPSKMGEIIRAMVSGLTKGISSIASVGKDLIRGLWNGISDMASWIGEKIRGFGSTVLTSLKNFFGIKSPSRVLRDEVGKMLAIGLGEGIAENADKPISAMADLSDSLLNEVDALNGATINRKLATTFAVQGNNTAFNLESLGSKLDGIYERLGRLQMVTDTGALVGEMLDKIDSGLGTMRELRARGV